MFDIVWPLTLLLAWLLGELGQRWLALPRISSYALLGVAIAAGLRIGQHFYPLADVWTLSLIPQLAFGLILFELGYRTNFAWLRHNRWLGMTSAAEATTTFAAVYGLGMQFSLDTMPALLLASLAVATSPMTIVPVINELRSAGQVTDRTLHLSALNCGLAIIAFHVVLGYGVLHSAGGLSAALRESVLVLAVSGMLGALFGVALPCLLRASGAGERQATVAYALAVAALGVTTHTLNYSPILATLVFGLVARWRRSGHCHVLPGFGVLGDLLLIVLFVHIGMRFDAAHLFSGLGLGLAVLAARCAAKGLCTVAFARLSGLTAKKGFLTGLALTPMASFAILLLDFAARRGLYLPDTLATMTGVLLLVDILSPLLTRFILLRAGEALGKKDSN